MRVALVGPYTSPGRPKGGVEASFQNLLAGLASFDDLELHVLTFAQGPGLEQEVEPTGFRLHRLGAPRRFNNVTLHRHSRRALGRALELLQPQIVHGQDALRHGYVCLKTARHAPVVVSVHGIARETRNLLASRSDRLQANVAGVALERYCIRNAEYLLQPTRYPQEYFGREIRGRIVDVGNAVADALFDIEPAPKPGRILYAGAIIPGKRVLDLIEAVARIPEASLRLVGRTPDTTYAAAVGERIRRPDLMGRVELLGRFDARGLLEEYRRGSVLVLPSAQETSPMVVAEAMASSIPVVATRVGGVPYLVEEGHTGYLVDVGDIGSLTRRVTQLIGDEPTRRSFAAAARSRAEQFRARAVAARVRTVYEEAVG